MRRTDEPTDIQIRPTTGAVASSVQGGLAYLSDIERRLAPYFERAKPRQRAMAYLQGLRSPAERQNSWQVAEVIGDATPSGLQPVLRRAVWEPDAVRNELRAYVIEHLGALNAVLVIDATGFLKKGRHSAGVARQDRGTAGRIENGQIGVCVAYASPHGQVLLDRELSLPKAWADDRDRCRQVGIPEDRRCATTPQLAQRMRARAFAAGVPATWVTGDRVYGDDRRLRLWLESCPQAHVLAVSGKEYVWLNWPQRRVKTILATLPDEGWTRLRAGDGAKGPRWYAWRWRPLAGAAGCWCGGGSATRANCRRTWSLRPRTPRWKQWCAWPAPAGPLRAALKRRRVRSAWIMMKAGAGQAGIGL
jgi:SRSO17 transposase